MKSPGNVLVKISWASAILNEKLFMHSRQKRRVFIAKGKREEEVMRAGQWNRNIEGRRRKKKEEEEEESVACKTGFLCSLLDSFNC